MQIACLLPAAGASSRMRGDDKLLEDVNGKPCLATLAGRALDAGMEVIVTLPSADHPRAEAIKDLCVQKVIVPNAQVGMSASLARAALEMSTDASGLMILPSDMPNITNLGLKAMMRAFERSMTHILRAQSRSGTGGHPIIFPKDITREFWHLTGDRGAQSLLRRYADRVEMVRFEDESPLQDLDTPEDWADWRASRQL